MDYVISTLIETKRDAWTQYKRICRDAKTPIRTHIGKVVEWYVDGHGKVETFPLGTVFAVGARCEKFVESVMKRRRCGRAEAMAYALALVEAGEPKLVSWLTGKSKGAYCRYLVPKVPGKLGRPRKVAQ
jgi:hypothetical protein